MKDCIESVCVFGSVARTSADAISDRDVLIVAQATHRRADLAHQWKAKGWSVSLYTPHRLNAIIRAGSLFVQHLRHEGLIVSDLGGWLKRRLQSSWAKPSYRHEARMSVSLAMPIERFNDDLLLEDCLLAADLAFVSVRNFGINYLADKGRLVFDYDTVVTETSQSVGLSNIEMDLLHSLRMGKSRYRGYMGGNKVEGTVGDLKRVLSKIFPHRPIGHLISGDPVRKLASGYARLRDLEAAVVSKVGKYPTSEQLTQLGLDDIWRWVLRPHDYSWNVRHFGEGPVWFLNGGFANDRSVRAADVGDVTLFVGGRHF